MLKMASLASGSSGNCCVVSDGRVHILIDAGVSAKRIVMGLKALDILPEDLTAILVTHEHSDHVNGLPVFSRQTGADICTAPATARQLCYRTAGLEERFLVFEPGERFDLGGLMVGTFPTSHDCACPVGFTVSDGTRKMALCTDTGVVTEEAASGVLGAGLLVCEFNHDVEMLRAGRYPAQLKARILGDWGHLSNEAGGALASWAARHGTGRVVLAHLSQENNTPALAMKAAETAMASAGVKIGEDVILTAAPRHECTGWMEVPLC